MKLLGVDQGVVRGDETAFAISADDGKTWIRFVPKDLGHITRLKRVRNAVVAETSSGVDILVR